MLTDYTMYTGYSNKNKSGEPSTSRNFTLKGWNVLERHDIAFENGLGRHDIASSNSLPAFLHSKSLGSVPPLLECRGKIFHFARR